MMKRVVLALALQCVFHKELHSFRSPVCLRCGAACLWGPELSGLGGGLGEGDGSGTGTGTGNGAGRRLGHWHWFWGRLFGVRVASCLGVLGTGAGVSGTGAGVFGTGAGDLTTGDGTGRARGAMGHGCLPGSLHQPGFLATGALNAGLFCARRWNGNLGCWWGHRLFTAGDFATGTFAFGCFTAGIGWTGLGTYDNLLVGPRGLFPGLDSHLTLTRCPVRGGCCRNCCYTLVAGAAALQVLRLQLWLHLMVALTRLHLGSFFGLLGALP